MWMRWWRRRPLERNHLLFELIQILSLLNVPDELFCLFFLFSGSFIEALLVAVAAARLEVGASCAGRGGLVAREHA
jgi:hypothetical protein